MCGKSLGTAAGAVLTHRHEQARQLYNGKSVLGKLVSLVSEIGLVGHRIVICTFL